MLKVIVRNHRTILPFNQPARDLRIWNRPLWLLQREMLEDYGDHEIEISSGDLLPESSEPTIVFKDNLVFNQEYISAFVDAALNASSPVQAAASLNDPAFREHALPLSTSYQRQGDLFLLDLWFYPEGTATSKAPEPLIVDSHSMEVGYYNVPSYMAVEQGSLTFQVPRRGILAIDSWVHIFAADMIYGLFGRGLRFEDKLEDSFFFKIRILMNALWEGRQVLQSSALVQVGENCVIDPSAVIHGPTIIGDNCTIGAGTVIDNCIIGDNVNISQGCQLMLSVVGDGSFLPFRAALFMTTLMDNSMVAQNACLQLSVIGRNSFVGAGTTFTDFNLLPAPIRARDGLNDLVEANRPVLGGCVGHNCRLGSGLTIYPARTIESDVVLVASPSRTIVDRDIAFEDSDHHLMKNGGLHRRQYPRRGEAVLENW